MLVLALFGAKAGISVLITSSGTENDRVHVLRLVVIGAMLGSLCSSIAGTVAGGARFMPRGKGHVRPAEEARAA